MSRFTIRELLLVTLVAGLALVWWLDRDRGESQLRGLSPELRKIVGAHLAQPESGRTEIIAGLMGLANKCDWKLPESSEWWDFTEIQMALIPAKPPRVVIALRTPSVVIPGDDHHRLILLDETGRKLDELKCDTNSRFTGAAAARLDQFKNDMRLLRFVLRFDSDHEPPEDFSLVITHSGQKAERQSMPAVVDRAGRRFVVLCECEVNDSTLFIQSPPVTTADTNQD